MTYGFMTHSYLKSSEKKAMDRNRKEYTKQYVSPGTIEVPLRCSCGCRPFPHELQVHREVLACEWDWRCFWPRELLRFWRKQ